MELIHFVSGKTQSNFFYFKKQMYNIEKKLCNEKVNRFHRSIYFQEKSAIFYTASGTPQTGGKIQWTAHKFPSA